MKVWVVVGDSESGDVIGPYVFDHPPFEDELKVTILYGEEEWEYLHFQTHEVEVIT